MKGPVKDAKNTFEEKKLLDGNQRQWKESSQNFFKMKMIGLDFGSSSETDNPMNTEVKVRKWNGHQRKTGQETFFYIQGCCVKEDSTGP